MRTRGRNGGGPGTVPGRVYPALLPTEDQREKLIPQLLDMVAKGRGLTGCCIELKIAPSKIRSWVAQMPDFARELDLARADGIEVWADEIIEIADGVAGCTEPAMVQAARVQIDSRKWMLSKLLPKQYGDKVELTGKDGKDLIPANSEARIPRLMQVLMVLLPDADNNELHGLASEMLAKLTGPTNGHDEAEDEELPAVEHDKRH